jgi:beta-glucanase (GH16 family)
VVSLLHAPRDATEIDVHRYDPAAITTRGGALEINLTKVDDPTTNHNLNYTGGMMTTWNKVGGSCW